MSEDNKTPPKQADDKVVRKAKVTPNKKPEPADQPAAAAKGADAASQQPAKNQAPQQQSTAKPQQPAADKKVSSEQAIAKKESQQVSIERKEWRMTQSAETWDDPLLGCLAVMTKLYGRPVSADSLKAGLPLQDNHFTPDLFVRAAARAKLSARLVKRPLKEIHQLVLPCVLLLEDNKACVLTEVDEAGNAKLIFPETGGGINEMPLEEIEKMYVKFCIFVKPLYEFDSRSMKGQILEDGKWFWGTISKFWKLYVEVIVAAFFINIFVVFSPLFVMNVYDKVVPTKAFDTLWVLAAGMLVINLFDLLLKSVRAYIVDLAGRGADTIIVSRLFERLLGMKIAAKPESSGSIANNLKEFESLREIFTSATFITLVDIPFVILFIIVIFYLAGPLGWIPTITAPLVLGVSYFSQKPLKRAVADAFQGNSHKGSIMYEVINGLDTIKRTGSEGEFQRVWEEAVVHSSKASMRTNTIASLITNFSSFVIQIVSVLTIFAGTYLIADGTITMGGLIAAVMLSSRTLAPLVQLARILNRVDQAAMSYKSLDAFMNIPLERPYGKTFLHRPYLKGAVEFKNVKFTYPGRNNPSITGVSIKINPGEKIGVIGQVGSGKSTIERLLSGLYDPTEGTILVDGNDIRQLDPADLRRNIGVVPQDIFLFFGSVKYNIGLSHPDINEQALTRAAYTAGVEDFIRTHPQGYDLEVGERGGRLSGGQRQAVAIARALALDPPILVMDEPTSAMDPGSSNRFVQRLREFSTEKTLIIITHRNALLELVDRLIVMDGGRIVADGPRDMVLDALKQGKIRGVD